MRFSFYFINGGFLASDVFERYSAGTELKSCINPDANRLVKEIYCMDMEKTQHSKLLMEIPDVDIVVTIGCNVHCPFFTLRGAFRLYPSRQSDEKFREVITQIKHNTLELAERFWQGV